MILHIYRLICCTSQRAAREGIGIATKMVAGTLTEIVAVVALMVGFGIGLTGCSTGKRTVVATTDIPSAQSEWHTCLMQNVDAVLTIDEQTLRATCTLQTVRDSIVVISVMPMLGIELLRIEATPDRIIGIDKINKQYTEVEYDEINHYLTPKIKWQDLQELASGEMPTGSQEAFVGYTVGKHTLMLKFTYPERQTDIPLRFPTGNLSRYQQIAFTNLLR